MELADGGGGGMPIAGVADDEGGALEFATGGGGVVVAGVPDEEGGALETAPGGDGVLDGVGAAATTIGQAHSKLTLCAVQCRPDREVPRCTITR